MSESESRKLTDLRVVQLRAELEKRGLDKTGVKQILVERLQKALVDEGLDPEVYQFDMSDKKQKTSTTSSNADNEDEQNDETAEKDTEQSELKNEDTQSATKESIKDEKETDKDENIQETSEDKPEQDDKEKNQDNKEESTIQLTLEEEEVLHDNDAENGENDNAAKENPSGLDEKKSTKDAPETAKDTTELNPAQQDSKKDEKSTGENSDAAASSKVKGISDSQNRNLWITNISQNTRATELKQALSAYGKVIGAKVVINARYPGACCYGYVKMETVEDANNCISKLNNTELNGQIIRIEKVRPEHLNPNLNINKRVDREKSRQKSSSVSKNDKDEKGRPLDDGKQDKKAEKPTDKKDKPDESIKSEGNSGERQSLKRSRSGDRKSRDRRRRRSRSRDRTERSLSSKSRRREREMVLTFDKIKDERDRERIRERQRLMREEGKRRREEALRQREIERRQRNEAQRLEREREKLRIERERLERERADLMLLERERQKLEREKLELEKLELERVKMRIQEEERRKRPAPYSRDRSYEERKRVPGDRHFDEPPPPPRFDPPPSAKTQQPSPPSNKFIAPNKTHTNLEKGDNFPHKRDRHYETERSHPQSSPAIQQRSSSQTMVKYISEVFNFNRERDMRDPSRGREAAGPSVSKYNSQVPKDTRYAEHERDRSPHFRGGVRDERDRRPIGDHKADIRSSRDHRYNEPPKDPGRFERTSSGGVWGHSSQGKVFNANNANTPQKSWGKESWRQSESSGGSDRWNSSTSRNGAPLSGGSFSNNSNMMNMGPSCPPPPGINNYVTDRYDYKGGMSYIRK